MIYKFRVLCSAFRVPGFAFCVPRSKGYGDRLAACGMRFAVISGCRKPNTACCLFISIPYYLLLSAYYLLLTSNCLFASLPLCLFAFSPLYLYTLIFLLPPRYRNHFFFKSVKNNLIIPHVLIKNHTCGYFVPVTNFNTRDSSAVNAKEVLIAYLRKT